MSKSYNYTSKLFSIKIIEYFLLVIFLSFPMSWAQDSNQDLNNITDSNLEFSSDKLPLKLDTIIADAAEWSHFDYEAVGLSQIEYQKIKETGISKSELLYLLELGIKPREYISKPWLVLRISKDQWLKYRSEGLEDSDIYQYKIENHGVAYLSFLVPSLYQWKTSQKNKAIGMDITYASMWAGFAALSFTKEDGMHDNLYFLPFIGAVHLWSFIDAIVNVRKQNIFEKNETFIAGIIPSANGIVGVLSFKF